MSPRRLSPRRPAPRLRTAGGRGDEGGSVSIETALVFPWFLIVVLLVVQVSMWWWANQIAVSAARMGAEAGRSYNEQKNAGATAANQLLQQMNEPVTNNSAVETPGTNADGQATVTVSVHVPVQAIIPFGVKLHANASVTSPKEVYLP